MAEIPSVTPADIDAARASMRSRTTGRPTVAPADIDAARASMRSRTATSFNNNPNLAPTQENKRFDGIKQATAKKLKEVGGNMWAVAAYTARHPIQVGLMAGRGYVGNVLHPVDILKNTAFDRDKLTKEEYAWVAGVALGGGITLATSALLPYGADRLARAGFAVGISQLAPAIYGLQKIRARREIYKTTSDKQDRQAKLDELEKNHRQGVNYLRGFARGLGAGSTYAYMFTPGGLVEGLGKEIGKAAQQGLEEYVQDTFNQADKLFESPPLIGKMANEKTAAFMETQDYKDIINQSDTQLLNNLRSNDNLLKNLSPEAQLSINDALAKDSNQWASSVVNDAIREALRENPKLSSGEVTEIGKESIKTALAELYNDPKQLQEWYNGKYQIARDALNEYNKQAVETTTTPTATITPTRPAMPSPTTPPTPIPPGAPQFELPNPAPNPSIAQPDDILKAKTQDYIKSHNLNISAEEAKKMENDLKLGAAAAVGKHLDISVSLANQATKELGIDPRQLSDEAFEKIRMAVQIKMETQDNTDFLGVNAKTATSIDEIIKEGQARFDYTASLLKDPAQSETRKPFIEAAKQALNEQLTMDKQLSKAITTSLQQTDTFAGEPVLHLDPDLATAVTIQPGDTVSGLITKNSGYKITWDAQNIQEAKVFGTHVAVNYELLDKYWPVQAEANRLADAHFPVALNEIYTLIKAAEDGDALAIQKLLKLRAALHWIPAGKEFIVLKSSGVDKVLSVLKELNK